MRKIIKITYVSVKGLDQARKDVERYSKEAVRLLEELPCENGVFTRADLKPDFAG